MWFEKIFLEIGLVFKYFSNSFERLLVYELSQNKVDNFDREKIIDCMFDPITSSLIAELEDGEKSSAYLAEKSSLSESEVNEKLSYLVTNGFIFENKVGGETKFSANVDKLSDIVENDQNFGAAVEGLEKMDSFLN